MLTISAETLARLEAITKHPNAWFTLDDLLVFLGQNPHVEPLSYVNTVELQLGAIGLIKGFLAERERHGLKNSMEGLAVACAALGLAVSTVTDDRPMPNEDIAINLAAICSQTFSQNVSVRWKTPKWVKPPSIELPHSTN